MRTESVFRPRPVRYVSNGDGFAPTQPKKKRSCSWKPGTRESSPQTMPPTTSEWPPMYFVVECTTTSAPSSNGFCRYGEAKVLSTTSAACFFTAAMASMSTMSSIGFVGVSTQMALVLSLTAAATSSGLVMSTTVFSTPHCVKTCWIRR